MELDVTKQMNLADLKQFFSATHEYRVTEVEPELFRIDYDSNNGPMDTLISRPSIQTLIRSLSSMSYLEGSEYTEKELAKKR